ncbi:MAG: bifunctional adenosylcobinamide kinase/adenosylcobinamide-phosphate guanylyltransferase [Acidobacteriota bacterium]
MLTLLTGGARSGKSREALRLAEAVPSPEARYFLATAEPLDGEMSRRIDRHREERGGAFETIEEPLDVVGALDALPATAEVVILDCLTLWLTNVLVHRASADAGREAPGDDLDFSSLPDSPLDYPPLAAFLERLERPLPFHLVAVTNEVGLGIVPGDPLSRTFRDLAGWLNQEVARRADRVVLMVSGCPLVIREPAP